MLMRVIQSKSSVRTVRWIVVVSCLLVLFSASPLSRALATSPAGAATMGDDGLHKQPWFHESFLELSEDLAEARNAGKGIIVAFEQAGCPYCREMHRVNFADDEIVSFLNENFLFIQLDLRGAREVTDFDGTSMEERELARQWGVVFTPTLLFFSAKSEIDASKPIRDQAAAIMPGYFKKFHFRTMLEYVSAGHYNSKSFQDYVNERADKLRAEGKDVTIW